jgi:hypothetical protein
MRFKKQRKIKYHTSNELNNGGITMNKEWIINTWEQDWDNENMYYKVRKNGLLVKINIVTGECYKYYVNQVVH